MSSIELEEKDLEKLRDERCFPVAKAIFKEFPEGLIVEPEEQKELQLKALSAMLAADLNVAQDVSFVFQLLLGLLAGINASLQSCDLVNDEVKYEFLAQDILKIVSEALENFKLDATADEMVKQFESVKPKLVKLFQDGEYSSMEVKYAMQKVFENFTSFNNAVQSSIENSTQRMETKILGIESMADLTLKKLNDVLLKPQ